MDEQRWRYQKSDGTPVWLPFRPEFPCLYCDHPVTSLSFGGSAVCPACDCGINRDGTQWTGDDLYRLMKNAKRRLDGMPDDPTWDEYEIAHGKSLIGNHPLLARQ
jgi:hypothetical protein